MISNKAMIEGVIFANPHPVSEKLLADILEFPIEEVRALLEVIGAEYASDERGFELRHIAGGYQFRTKADLREPMAKFNEKKPPRLTQATLEVLSVIAYKQPITRPEVERIRGVDCTGVLKTLLERELIEMRGRSDLPGHPVVYGTTEKFLEWFQIDKLNDLPPLSEMEALNRGFDKGAENLLGLLNRDEGFVSESLSEMDETLKKVTKFEIVDPFAAAEAKDEATEEVIVLDATENHPNSHSQV
ncbi:MAG: SMC-Scp complex subunit ScpB [Deltaproteobacteria bacterium]|nr:SMC-Scp complex subunit ScpB [Deltaproteobacteria bacterium]